MRTLDCAFVQSCVYLEQALRILKARAGLLTFLEEHTKHAPLLLCSEECVEGIPQLLYVEYGALQFRIGKRAQKHARLKGQAKVHTLHARQFLIRQECAKECRHAEAHAERREARALRMRFQPHAELCAPRALEGTWQHVRGCALSTCAWGHTQCSLDAFYKGRKRNYSLHFYFRGLTWIAMESCYYISLIIRAPIDLCKTELKTLLERKARKSEAL